MSRDRQTSLQNLIGRVKNGASQCSLPALMLFPSLFAARALELLVFLQAHQAPPDLRAVLVQAALFDAVFFLKALPLLFLLFLIVSLAGWSDRTCRAMFVVAGSATLFVSALLSKFFTTTLVPLGSDLFGYSPAEIAETVSSGVTIDLAAVVAAIAPLMLFWSLLSFFRSRPLPGPGPFLTVFAAGVVALCAAPSLPARTAFSSELSYSLALNKPAFFLGESIAYFSPRPAVEPPSPQPTATRKPRTGRAFEYIDPAYPFLRKDETEDVLGRFFAVDAHRPPNLVFILVEGLGKAFSGPNAYLGSFTPFLDELAGKSLYWENFLASQGRTFAALPSLLASLPYGEQGFNELKQKMPKHLSLLSILKHNGYRLKFYFGSDPDFDNERMFLMKQGVDVLVGKDDFGGGYTLSPGSSWGYPDRELMRKTLDLERRDTREPFVAFIQTMSMHTSYSVPDQERYVALFEERMTALGFDEARKKRYREYQDIYATILYADDALRYFFDGYRALPAFANTIFIITGDHRLPEIEMSTKIDRFHVPLIIFSPLLRKPMQFESISSQLDITPSLVAFLKKNYRIDAPSAVTWVGSGLDTERTLRNIHSYPLKHTKTNLIDYLSGMYFLDQDVLFRIGKAMDLEPVQDEKKKKELIEEFDRYKAKNDRFSRELKLIPDSLYEQYRPR